MSIKKLRLKCSGRSLKCLCGFLRRFRNNNNSWHSLKLSLLFQCANTCNPYFSVSILIRHPDRLLAVLKRYMQSELKLSLRLIRHSGLVINYQIWILGFSINFKSM